MKATLSSILFIALALQASACFMDRGEAAEPPSEDAERSAPMRDPEHGAANTCRQDSDGCSYPMPLAAGRVFSSACTLHDHCYATPGADKDVCDDQMHTDMMRICDDLFPDDDAQYDRCADQASRLRDLVYLFADSTYERVQSQVSECTQVFDRGVSFYSIERYALTSL